jgi:hypothetical protein
MCRKKKIKCDGKMPKCSHCTNYKTDCVFTQVEKKRNPPKGYAYFSALPLGAHADFPSRLVPSISRASKTD